MPSVICCRTAAILLFSLVALALSATEPLHTITPPREWLHPEEAMRQALKYAADAQTTDLKVRSLMQASSYADLAYVITPTSDTLMKRRNDMPTTRSQRAAFGMIAQQELGKEQYAKARRRVAEILLDTLALLDADGVPDEPDLRNSGGVVWNVAIFDPDSTWGKEMERQRRENERLIREDHERTRRNMLIPMKRMSEELLSAYYSVNPDDEAALDELLSSSSLSARERQKLRDSSAVLRTAIFKDR